MTHRTVRFARIAGGCLVLASLSAWHGVVAGEAQPAQEAREAMLAVLPYVDVVFPSHPEETKALSSLDSKADIIEFFKSKGAHTVALKCGDEGAWVGTHEGIGTVPPVAPLGVSDTTGAGDAFVGTFLHCLLQGRDAFEATRWGVVAAGLTTGGRGAILSQPDPDEILKYLGAVRIQRV